MADFDATISIGAQSLIASLMRLLGPQLEGIKGAVPIALPGLSNSVLSIRRIVPIWSRQQPGDKPNIELQVAFDLVGSVPLTVRVDSVPLGLKNLDKLRVHQPATAVPLSLNPVVSALGAGPQQTIALNPIQGVVGVGPAATPVQLQNGTGTLSPLGPLPIKVPQTSGVATMPEIESTLEGVNNTLLPLPPLPVVADLALDLAELMGGSLLEVTVKLAIDINPNVDAASGFAVNFDFKPVEVSELQIFNSFVNAVMKKLDALATDVLKQLATKFLLGSLVQPLRDLLPLALGLQSAIPEVVKSVMTRLFGFLTATTGRLLGSAAGGALGTCETKLAPSHGKAKLEIGPNGQIVLHLGFARASGTSTAAFASFSATATVDVRVTISNAFLLELVSCILEKLPNLLLLNRRPTSTGGIQWDITIALGPTALRGTLTLSVEGQGSAKRLRLAFRLVDTINDPILNWIPLAILVLSTDIDIAFGLNGLTSITSLRPFQRPEVQCVVSAPVLSGLVGGAVINLGIVLQPAVAALVGGTYALAIGTVQTALQRVMELALKPAAVLASPVAVPTAVFEAFGSLLPAEVTLDDLEVRGTLLPGTTPWTRLPLIPSPGVL